VRVDLETHRRDREFECLKQALAAGIERLPHALRQRWADPTARRAWCEAAVLGAAGVLGPGGWRVEHAAGLAAEEVARVATMAAARGSADCVLAESQDLGAGLRVLRSGASYDATVAGLTAQREQLEAALLAEITALTGGEVTS
jgi:hypothetical protein